MMFGEHLDGFFDGVRVEPDTLALGPGVTEETNLFRGLLAESHMPDPSADLPFGGPEADAAISLPMDTDSQPNVSGRVLVFLFPRAYTSFTKTTAACDIKLHGQWECDGRVCVDCNGSADAAMDTLKFHVDELTAPRWCQEFFALWKKAKHRYSC